MSLSEYSKKRNFDKTPEPNSGGVRRTKSLSFVVQRHEASHLHYDFRLEMDGVLKSWAIPKGPSMIAGEKRLAVLVEDHPFSYGSFYGEIPKGNYGAGIVSIFDKGTYIPLEKESKKTDEQILLEGLKKGDLKFTLRGKHLKGAFALVRMNDGAEKNWLLIKKKDSFAMEHFDIEKIEPLRQGKPASTPRNANAGKTTRRKATSQASKKKVMSQTSRHQRLSQCWPQSGRMLIMPKDGYMKLNTMAIAS